MPEGLERGSGKRIYLLDASALLLGFAAPPGEKQATTPQILQEIRYGGAAPFRAAVAEAGVSVRVVEPGKSYLERVKREAEDLGEPGLSEADLTLLALALEAKEVGWEPILVSADYAVQNVASHIGLEVEPILHRGIERKIRWRAYCPACGWRGGAFTGGNCPKCGGRLKRAPIF